MANEIELTVPDELDGARLDKALAVLLSVSRTLARDMLDDGVTVDGHPSKPADRLRQGQVIMTPPPPDESALEPEPVEFGILYEDQSVAVVDKPAGLVVHPGSGHQRGTLAAGLLYRYPTLKGVGAPGRWGIVHRLDMDTSGVLMVALTQPSFEKLAALLRDRKVSRRYTTLVDGILSAPTGTIDAPIGRDPGRPTRRAVVDGGKQARTHYEVARVFEGSNCSLLDVSLETGRTHQIRVHMAAIGHPVIGDRIYGSRQVTAKAPRIFLHAAQLRFPHPEKRVLIDVTSPLPDDLDKVLADLGSIVTD